MRKVLLFLLIVLSQLSFAQSTKPAWSYDEKEDKMTSKKIHYAQVDANEKLFFHFPYDGGSTASVLLRYADGLNSFIFNLSKGHFVHTNLKTTEVRLRFDDEQPISYKLGFPDDGDANYVGVSGSDADFLEPQREG